MSKSVGQKGFTIVELALSTAIAGVLAVVLFSVTFYYYANAMQAQTSTDLSLGSQTVLTQMTEDIRLADAISNTNALPDANAPTGGWVTSNPSNVIIIESPAIDSSRNIIFDPSSSFPYRNEFIYFKSGNSMYKRTLANSAATGNTAITTCPSNKASSTCPPDVFLSDNVSNLNFTFYDASYNSTSDATQARAVSLEVDMAQDSFGRNVSLQNKTSVTLRNQ